MSLEAYARARPTYRKTAIAHKRLRTVHIGDHVTLLFEDEMTIRYQLQEVLRVGKRSKKPAFRTNCMRIRRWCPMAAISRRPC